MPLNVQMVRNPSALASTQIGLLGQIIMDTGANAIRLHDAATPGGHLHMIADNNLSELTSPAEARVNLDLGTAAQSNTGDFDPAGSAATAQANAEAFATAADVVNLATAEANVPNTNRLINGDFRVSQYYGTTPQAVVGAIGYYIDRWYTPVSQNGKLDQAQNANGAPPAAFSAGFSSQSAFAPAVGDYFLFAQSIEANNLSDIFFGSAVAKSLTLSFWVFSSLTGNFAGSIKNYGSARSYVFQYNIPVANTFTYITVTIPGDMGGVWAGYGTNGALIVSFDLGCGSNYAAPTANAWYAGNYITVAGSVKLVGTNAATIFFANVKLEVGSVATRYIPDEYGESLRKCQRYYYQRSYAQFQFDFSPGMVINATTAYWNIKHPVPMRVTPALSFGIAPTSWGLQQGLVGYAITNIVSSSGHIDGSSMLVTCGGGGLTAAAGCMMYMSAGTGDNYSFSAEL